MLFQVCMRHVKRASNYKLAVALGILAVLILSSAILFWLVEDWTYGNCIYFCIITVTTIGYGDMSPQTDWGRFLVIVYALFGLGLVGYAVTVIGEWIVELMERQRKFALRILRSSFEKAGFTQKTVHRPSIAALGKEEREARKSWWKRWANKNMKLIVAFVAFILFMLLGSLMFWLTERSRNNDPDLAHNMRWSFWHGVYFSFITLSSIGYGDFSPATTTGRIFGSVYALLGLGLVGVLISELGDTVMSKTQEVLENERRHESVDIFLDRLERSLPVVRSAAEVHELVEGLRQIAEATQASQSRLISEGLADPEGRDEAVLIEQSQDGQQVVSTELRTMERRDDDDDDTGGNGNGNGGQGTGTGKHEGRAKSPSIEEMEETTEGTSDDALDAKRSDTPLVESPSSNNSNKV